MATVKFATGLLSEADFADHWGKTYEYRYYQPKDSNTFRVTDLVRGSRTVCNEEENLSGFILGMSRKFLFLQLENEFTLNGYAVIRLDDFDSIRHSSYERTYRKIFSAEGLLSTEYGFDKPLPLANWTDIFKTLKTYDIHVIIENINKGELDFWIGSITRVSEKSVRMCYRR